ncbi:cadherin-12-like [Ptychodera flava]|uniref:cadherin-12-like n=1 Tax=Ptychodera flava TaxID=63121 RepID=UPI00396A46DF
MANWRNPLLKQTALYPLTYALAIFFAIQPNAVVYGALCDFTPSNFDDVSVYEERPIGTLLYTLDVEGDTASEITLSLDDCKSGRSNLHCDQVWNLEDKNMLWAIIYDLESDEVNCEGVYAVWIRCTINGQPHSSTNFQLQVFIYDLNDNDPVFVGTPYVANVGELAEIGHTVYVVSSEDKDCSARQPLYGAIGGTGADYFAFESSISPSILVTNSLDYELDKEYTLILMVDDRDGRSSTTVMDVLIEDEDDMTPIFSEVVYESEVLENIAEVVLPVIPKIHAYDHDFGINETVYYSFADPNRQNDAIFETEHFNIDNETADITVTSGLDRESLENGKLTVMLRAAQVSSRGYQMYSYRDTHASLVVTVLDVNDNTPTMSDNEYHGTVPIDSPPGTIAGGVNGD